MSLFRIHPQDQDILYLVSGKGLSKSTDRGNSFEEVFYEQQVLDIAFHPRDKNIIYISTLEGSILKSNDGGTTWQTLYWGEGSKGVSKIKISLSNPALIYAAVGSKQLLKSVDGGDTFEKLKAKMNAQINDIEIQDDNTLYVATERGLFKTEDGGQTFKEVKTLMPPKGAGIKILKASPQDDNTFYYATREAIYKTTDKGKTWKVFRITTGVRYTAVAVSSQDPNTVFVGTRALPHRFLRR